MSKLTDLRYASEIAALVRPTVRLALLRGGLDDDVFSEFLEPRTASEFAETRAVDRALAASWLRAAAAAGWLERHGNAYTSSPFVRWLLETEMGDAGRAMLEEAVLAYEPILGSYPARMKSQDRPAWNGDTAAAERVARGSRVIEGRALKALFRVPGVRQARRFMDIGCGEGVYLMRLLERHRDSLGDGVELDAGVAERARVHLARAGVQRRAEIHTGDFHALELPHGSYDLVLLNNNLYYFQDEEREPLFERILEHLSPKGVLAIQSPFVSDDPLSRWLGVTTMNASFDAFLRIHSDLAGLPEPDELNAQLQNAGFSSMGTVPIVPGGSVRFVWARKAGRG